MKNTIKLIVAVILMLHSGCASVDSKVSRFHSLGPVAQPKIFEFVPIDEQKGSIEFRSYAERISTKLEAYGWRRDQAKKADVFVSISYGIGDGKSVSGAMPIFGQTGGGAAYTSGSVYGGGRSANFSATTFTAPTYGQIGAIPVNQTYYTRTFVMNIYDSSLAKEGVSKSIFEGRVVSTGSSSQVSEIMPNMIEAMFKKFPGSSGKTIDVTERFMK